MGVIEEMRRRINKIRWERWRAKQNKELEKSYFYARGESWNEWQECPGSGNSVSGAYTDFYIRYWRSGQSDCEDDCERRAGLGKLPCVCIMW